MSATAPTPGVYVVTAADFVSGAATIAASHRFSFSMPPSGISIPVPASAIPDARAASTSGSQTRSAAPPHCGPRKRGREYVLGQRFQMRYVDAAKLWPGWETCDKTRVQWTVSDYTPVDNRLLCEYAGRSEVNRDLIGNGGVCEFALSQIFHSSDTLASLLDCVPAPVKRYHQIAAKRCHTQPRPSTAISKFTDQSRCPHCKTQLFKGETSQMCCFNGKFVLPRGQPNPPELERLLNNRKFPLYARLVNQHFCMTSIGTKRTGGSDPNPSAQFVNFRRGIGCTRLHGQSYHRCLPGNQAGGIEYYIYDKEHERARAQLPHAIPSSHIDDLRQFFLRENSHVRAIRCMADVEAATATLVLRHNVSTNELASFTLEEHGDDHVRSRDIVFHRHSNAEPTFMNVGSALYDTLQFPLLHPYGGTTWHFGCKVNGRKISLAEYTKYLHLQSPPAPASGETPTHPPTTAPRTMDGGQGGVAPTQVHVGAIRPRSMLAGGWRAAGATGAGDSPVTRAQSQTWLYSTGACQRWLQGVLQAAGAGAFLVRTHVWAGGS